MHPYALPVFIARTSAKGMHVQVIQDNDARAFARFRDGYDGVDPEDLLDALSGIFDQIVALYANLTEWKTLHRVLQLGRQARMARLKTLQASMDAYQSPEMQLPEVDLADLIIDWDMPSVTLIDCSDIPLNLRRSSGATPAVKFRSNCHNSLSDFVTRLQDLSLQHLALLEVEGFSGIILEEPGPTGGIVLPNVTECSIQLMSAWELDDPRLIQHPSNFNRLRLPKLQLFSIGMCPEFGPGDLWGMQDVLMSMKHVRFLEIRECVGPFEDFLDESIFPHLEECLVSHCYQTPDSFKFSRVKAPNFPLTRFPASLRRIQLSNSVVDENFTEVALQMLRALHARFGMDYSRGILNVLETLPHNNPAVNEFAATVKQKLDENTAKRLSLVDDCSRMFAYH